jgi:hypothetical protein
LSTASSTACAFDRPGLAFPARSLLPDTRPYENSSPKTLFPLEIKKMPPRNSGIKKGADRFSGRPLHKSMVPKTGLEPAQAYTH